MTPEYQAFLASKAPRAQAIGIEPSPMPDHLLDFAGYATSFAVRSGRAALFLSTGMTKTRCQLEYSKQAAAATNGRALILTPLAVARQFEREGLPLGYDVRVVRDQSEVTEGINVCNYDRLDKLDTRAFGSVSLDESSVLKSYTGKTTRALIEAFAETRFKLCATATPAPNDHMELGQHAEFLGVMPSNEMLARWFITDQTQMGRYRLKGHATIDFWDWMASWAMMADSPDDLGFDGSRFVLPDLSIHRHRVIGDVRRPAGELFVSDVSATNMHTIKRQTATARADAVATLIAAEPSEFWVIWCDTDYESAALMDVLSDAKEVRGSQSIDLKESTLAAFAAGEFGQIVTKPSVAGFGVNWQHVARMAFVGRSFSFEQWHQAVRRCWRFGQKRPVDVHIIVAEGEEQIGRVIDRKSSDHAAMIAAMREASRRKLGRSSELKVAYDPKHDGRLPEWLVSAA